MFICLIGTPITRVPIMAKQPLDLYRLFKLVVERGGLVEVKFMLFVDSCFCLLFRTQRLFLVRILCFLFVACLFILCLVCVVHFDSEIREKCNH